MPSDVNITYAFSKQISKKLIFSEDMRLGKYTYDVRVLERVPENRRFLG